jgi:hypothetical protein
MRRRALAGIAAACAGLLGGTSAPHRARADEPSLESVLKRAAVYVDGFHRQLSTIAGEETYEQEVKGSSTLEPGSAVAGMRRRLRSDLLLVRPAGSERYVEFRDVFEVDGESVRDGRERLTALVFTPGRGASDQLGRIINDSARYNIGNIRRNVNTPLLSLLFLDAAYQPRFRFTRATATTSSVVESSEPPSETLVFRVSMEMWVIEYREVRRGTVIRTLTGGDLPVRGRFWIDPASGRVLMSELRAEEREMRMAIDVSYQSEPVLGFLVPIEMRERYIHERDHIVGRAVYSNFRPIGTTPREPPDEGPGK